MSTGTTLGLAFINASYAKPHSSHPKPSMKMGSDGQHSSTTCPTPKLAPPRITHWTIYESKPAVPNAAAT